HAPVLGLLAVVLDLPGREIDGHVPGQRVLIQEVPLDDVAAVTERHEELARVVARVVLHDVPEDGAAADLHHGFRLDLGLLCQPGPEATSEDDDLHDDGARLARGRGCGNSWGAAWRAAFAG